MVKPKYNADRLHKLVEEGASLQDLVEAFDGGNAFGIVKRAASLAKKDRNAWHKIFLELKRQLDATERERICTCRREWYARNEEKAKKAREKARRYRDKNKKTISLQRKEKYRAEREKILPQRKEKHRRRKVKEFRESIKDLESISCPYNIGEIIIEDTSLRIYVSGNIIDANKIADYFKNQALKALENTRLSNHLYIFAAYSRTKSRVTVKFEADSRTPPPLKKTLSYFIQAYKETLEESRL